MADKIRELSPDDLESVLGGRDISDKEVELVKKVIAKMEEKFPGMSYEEQKSYCTEFSDAALKKLNDIKALPDDAPDVDVDSYFKHLF